MLVEIYYITTVVFRTSRGTIGYVTAASEVTNWSFGKKR